ncbi:MAG: hypothetical protein H6670_08320 [Anaerolineaceae bacterium]|nr:hypothetical protein [Anaerolineaceae bacterium]
MKRYIFANGQIHVEHGVFFTHTRNSGEHDSVLLLLLKDQINTNLAKDTIGQESKAQDGCKNGKA